MAGEEIEKQFTSANELLLDSFRLAKRIYDSGFHPNFIAAIWRGGTPIGCAVQEFFAYKGRETDHIAIRTSAYEDTKRKKEVKVYGLDYLVAHANHDDSLLIVDDVFDTGLSVQAVIDELRKQSRTNTPYDIRIATVYYKPKKNRTWPRLTPHFYLYETEKWVSFPHELRDHSEEQIRLGKGEEVLRLLK